MFKITKKNISKLITDPVGTLKTLTDDNVVRIIQKANQAYHSDAKPIFSDEIYEIIKEELVRRLPEHPILSHIGSSVVHGEKFKLPYHMGSMNKIKSDNADAINKFSNTYPGNYIITDKLDGFSALLTFKNKSKEKLYSRGDGDEGQDISHILSFINGIPSSVTNNIVVRGELVISKANFSNDDGKNPLNVVAGMGNAKTPNLDVAGRTDFVAHELIIPELKPSQQMTYLKKLGFNTVYSKSLTNINSEILSNILMDRRKHSPYNIDGIVVTHDAIHDRPIKGNPLYSFAFKSVLTTEKAEVIVTEVEWDISKDGYYHPVVTFDGVKLDGAVISRATGYNGKFIKDGKIGPGARIIITRSGSVIPKILEVIKPAEKWAKPSGEWKWSGTNVDIVSTHAESAEIIYKNYEYFFRTLAITGLGPATILKIYKGGLDTVGSLLHADLSTLLSVLGPKTASKLFDAFQKYDFKPALIMKASNKIGRGFGETKLIPILNIFPNIITQRYIPSVEELVALNGIESKTAEKFVNNLPDFFTFIDDNEISFTIDDSEENSTSKAKDTVTHNENYKGQKIVFSGVRDKVLEDIIVKNGGSVTTAVSKNTTLVVAKDVNEKTGKINKARNLGVPIMSLSDFRKRSL